MARLNINPTRMELLQLKKKLATARRGHKLLKEKRDGLMKEFLKIIREAKALREKIDQELNLGFRDFIFASADMSPEAMEEALCYPAQEIVLEADTKNVMSVEIPVFNYHTKGTITGKENEFLCYSLATTHSGLDTSLEIFHQTLADMIKLAEIEHGASLLAAEIEKTRRRVNALEYVFIPNTHETIKYIASKLSEQERCSITALLRVKEIIAGE
ncbi:MAG: V-type ATP synthase subunit D [bacterium]